VRFLKSSANEAELSVSDQPSDDRYSGTSVNRSHDSTGYRDEFTK
jgi:hypothetical protein